MQRFRRVIQGQREACGGTRPLTNYTWENSHNQELAHYTPVTNSEKHEINVSASVKFWLVNSAKHSKARAVELPRMVAQVPLPQSIPPKNKKNSPVQKNSRCVYCSIEPYFRDLPKFIPCS